MAIIPVFKGKIENCQLVLEDRENYNNYLISLNDTNIEVIVRKPRKIRSERQNRYYWGVVLKLISETTGEDIEDLHNHFAYKHLQIKGKSGKLLSRKSTTQLSIIEFMEYIDKIIRWGEMFLKIRFPEPDEVEYDFVIS